MAKARLRYRRITPLEVSIFNLRLVVDKAPDPLIEAQGPNCQRAWAYMRDANGGNALSKLSRYETSLLREYDRSRHELETLQKIRTAKPIPPPYQRITNRHPAPATQDRSKHPPRNLSYDTRTGPPPLTERRTRPAKRPRHGRRQRLQR